MIYNRQGCHPSLGYVGHCGVDARFTANDQELEVKLTGFISAAEQVQGW